METNFEKIKYEVKELMSEKRYNHTLGVVEQIEYISKKFGLNIQKAKLVALTHDIAKEMSEDERDYYIKKYNIEVSEEEKKYSELIHGKIGAYVVQEKYGFDEEMKDAIMKHTKGSTNMSDLAKALYVSDVTESRVHNSVNARKLVDQSSTLDEAFMYCVTNKFRYLLKQNNLLDCLNLLIYVSKENNKDLIDLLESL